ncbi:MAG: ATPase [Roseateles depolymerans]|uniref:ATPase n=1 Tax=Roseateles depolymerans TaxID=76731 RepID=A0A2W5DE20_9BURK|nr:MAG: ATPase [Roseateles depolymerans]
MSARHYGVDIAAPVARVWGCMLDPLGYRDWTRAFCEGSYYEGRWQTGERLRFLDPQGNGMEAVVDDCRLHERVSLRLVGELREGRPLADSALLREPAHERYAFGPAPDGGTRLEVQLQGMDGCLDFLDSAWPVALQRLKALAETPL